MIAQSNQLPLLTRILFIIALVMMLFHFFVYVVYSVELIQFPFDYDQGEGFELVDTMYLSEGRSPYRNNEEFPFYASNYPPVYHLVLVPFAWVFGAEYWYGRLVAFLSTLITAGAIGYAIKRAEGRRDIAILMGLAFLASNYIYHIGPLFRQHYFMVMFEVLAVVLLVNVFELPKLQQRRRWMWGLLLLLLAGYTKQLAVVTVAAVFIWFFLRNPRQSVVYAIGFAVATGAIFLAINIATNNEWWNNAVAANVNQYILSQFTGLIQQFVRLHWVLLLFTGLMVVYELYFSRLSLYSVWVVIALVSTVGSGTWGAGDSYFATSIAGMCILSGIFIARTINQTWQLPDNFWATGFKNRVPWQRMGQGAGAFCVGLMVIYGATVVKLPTNSIFAPLAEALNITPQPGHRYPLYDAAGWTAGYATIGHIPSEEDVENGWRIVEQIRASEKPVMSEEAGFSLRAGREVISNPTQLQNLYDNNLLDPKPIVDFIENQGFGLVIFRAEFYPEPVIAAVYDAYYPRELIYMNGFNYAMWYPEPTWETRRQIRDYLEAPQQTTPLEIMLEINAVRQNDLDQWMIDTMGRWAWLPALDTPSTDVCEGRKFVRRGVETTLKICNGMILVSVPEPLDL